MTPAKATWNKGRGKLGVLDPLLGQWQARVDSDMGKVFCTRTFRRVLGHKYPHLDGGVSWVVEAKTNRGWKRFTEHHHTA